MEVMKGGKEIDKQRVRKDFRRVDGKMENKFR